MTTIINLNRKKSGPGCLTQVLWFVFVGWWASLAAVTLAWGLMVTIIGIPLGIAIVNKMPKIVALREPSQTGLQIIQTGNVTIIQNAQVNQRSFLIRALYFVLFGWWWCGIVMSLAWALCCTIIGMPLGFKLFDYAPKSLTLHR